VGQREPAADNTSERPALVSSHSSTPSVSDDLAREAKGGVARTRARDLVPVLVLAAVGVLSVAIYLSLTVRMSLQEFFPGPGVTIDFKDMLGPDWRANTVRLYASFAGLLALWLVAVVAAGKVSPERAKLLLFFVPVVFAAILASIYPFMAVDFFHNLGDGRLLWRHGVNPMTNGPGVFFPIGISFGDEPSAYGPLWYLLLAPPSLLGGDDYLRSLILLKLWMGVFLLVAAVLTWQIARKLAPGREGVAVTLLAWNPFVVLRVMGNGHNDVVMMCFVLAAVWLALDRRWVWVPPAIAGAVLVKYAALLVAPAFLLCALRLPSDVRRRSLHRLVDGILIAVWLMVLAFVPFWDRLHTFDALRKQAGKFITSTPLLLAYFLERYGSMTPEDAESLAARAATALFLLIAAVLVVRQRPGVVALIATCATLLLAYNLLALLWFRPWYFLWVVMLTPLLPGRWWPAIGIAASAGGLLPDVIEQYRNNMGWLQGDYFRLIAAPVVVAFAPPAAVWLAGYAANRRREMDADLTPRPPSLRGKGESGVDPA
jgi:hypothetical protein